MNPNEPNSAQKHLSAPWAWIRKHGANRPLLLLAATALLAAGWMGVRRTDSADASLNPGPFGILNRPSLPTPSYAKRQAEGASAASDLDEFLKLLESAREIPAAKAFAEEFLKEPGLAEDWEQVRTTAGEKDGSRLGGGGGKRPLEEFAGKMLDKPQFQALVARFSQDPGFRQVALSIVKQPAIHQALKEALARGVSPATRRLLAGLSRHPGSPANPSDREGSAFSTAVGGGRGASGLGDRDSTEHQADGAARRSASQTTSPAGNPVGGGERAAAYGLPPNPPGPNAHEVQTALTPALDAGWGEELNPWRSLCLREDPAISRAECVELLRWLGAYGIWGSCYKAGLYDRCAELCRGKPELHCDPPATFGDACVDAGKPKRECATEACRRKGGSQCELCPTDGPTLDSDSCEDPASSSPAACQARSEKLQPKRECIWEGKYGRCFCFWAERKESRYLKLGLNTEQCREHARDINRKCFLNSKLVPTRCQCLSPAQEKLREECEGRGDGSKWLIALARCSGGSNRELSKKACEDRNGRVLPDNTCSVHPNCNSEAKPMFDGKNCVPQK